MDKVGIELNGGSDGGCAHTAQPIFYGFSNLTGGSAISPDGRHAYFGGGSILLAFRRTPGR